MRSFIVRNSEKFGQFNMIWMVQERKIKSAEILIKDGFCFLDFDPRIFDSLQSLIEFNMERNLLSVPLDNKELHRRTSQQRQFKQRTERLVYCWWCSAFHNKIHYCSTQVFLIIPKSFSAISYVHRRGKRWRQKLKKI